MQIVKIIPTLKNWKKSFSQINFVKNHQGSTMLTVDDRGRYIDGRAMDYLAYGSYKGLKVNGADPVTQKFMGKKYEKLLQLYAFTERMYDAELGMWSAPDPEEQYFNPYSYNGGDPVNMVDPTGARACSYDEWFSQLDPSFSGTVDCTGNPTDIRVYSDRGAEFVVEQYREAIASVNGSIGIQRIW